MKRLITIVAILHYIFLPAVFPNTLQVDEEGNILAETDRYLARFEKGVFAHFHNKLTQETYTDESSLEIFPNAGRTAFFGLTDGVWAVSEKPKIKKVSSTNIEIIYQHREARLHLFVGIDPQTDDLLIRQKGFTPNGGALEVVWTCKNLSHTKVDLILPCMGGIILNGENPEDVEYDYPGYWESQLAVFQGQRGGFFVRSDDTQFRFKKLAYQRSGEQIRVNFLSIPFAPFEKRKQVTSGTWRLNAYRGDWQVPAQMYREWMYKAFQPPDRKQMPAWINDIECIITNHAELDLEKLRILNQLVDPSKTLIYIYSWHEDGGDPPHRRDGFKLNFDVFVKEAHRYGFRVMIHTSISHIQADDPSYAAFEEYHVRDPRTGEKKGYKLNDPTYPTPAATINPASGSFRKMLVRELKYVWDTYGFDAVHLDFSISVDNDKNGHIDGSTMAEGVILLHQEIREAMPGIVISGESLGEISYPYENLAQRWNLPENLQPHLISTFLFPHIRLYGHLGYPNPDKEPEKFQARQLEYTLWGILPTIPIWDRWDLEANNMDRVETQKFFASVRQRQNYVFGDVNSDGVLNILDLTLIAQNLGAASNNRHLDVNKDGVINILDLILITQYL